MTACCPCLVHRCWRWCRWLALEVYLALVTFILRCWPVSARVPIIVLCGDVAFRRATLTVLRRALRDTERVMGRLPGVPLRIRVLAAAGTPPAYADLGHALAAWQMRATPAGPRVVLTLAAAAGGHPLTADQLVVALSAALDSLDEWRPGQPPTWTLPAPPDPVPYRLAHTAVRRSPGRPPVTGPGAGTAVPPTVPPALPPTPSPPTPPPPHERPAEPPPDDPLGLGNR